MGRWSNGYAGRMRRLFPPQARLTKVVNGVPISAGTFGASDSEQGRLRTAEVPANTEAKAVAVTVEPSGGVLQPTGPRVLLRTS